MPKEKGVDLKFRLFFNLGYAYDLLGDLRSSMSYYQLILEFIDEIENKRLIPHVYNNIGEIYRLTGELPEALKYYNLSLDMREQFGELRGAAVCHVNLGIVYSRMSLVKTAISHLKMGFEMFQELGNDLDTAEAMYHYILALLSSQVPNEIEEGIQLVEELKLLDIKTQNRRVSLFYRIITAVVLRQKNRSKYYAQAQEILEGIRSEKMIEFEFHIFAMLNLAELLFIEYKSIPSKEVYDDLYNLVQDLYKTAQEQLSYNVLVQILIILAKLAFISNQVRKAMLLLDQADLVTIEHDLKTLTVIVQTEREFMNKQLTKLSQIITHHDVQHKIEISELSEYMRDLTKMFK